MSEASTQFEHELSKLVNWCIQEGDLSIGDAIAVLELEKLNLHAMMREAKNNEDESED